MAIFGRKKSTDPEVPEDLQQYYNNAGGLSVLKWILRIVALLIFLALLVWGGLWLFHKLTAHKSTSAGKPTTSQQAKAPVSKSPTTQPGKSNTGTSSNNNSTATGNSPTPPPTAGTPSAGGSSSTNAPATPPPTSTQGTQGTGSNGQPLVNTGPGTIAMVWLFGAATLIGTALHAFISRRRAA